jgi:hypothetical protein
LIIDIRTRRQSTACTHILQITIFKEQGFANLEEFQLLVETGNTCEIELDG